MLKNFWYVIEFSKGISHAPVRLTVLGRQLVAYREPCNPVVMSDLCIHWGAALSSGEVEGGCLRCPYDGWKYQPGGRGIEIPALPRDRSIPHKAWFDSYPALDRYGWLWGCLGDLPVAERSPHLATVIPSLAGRQDPELANAWIMPEVPTWRSPCVDN
jgi:phenylpropionate dioxygenase-like ring-hydroxylating dioxygenase large terminal subunit